MDISDHKIIFFFSISLQHSNISKKISGCLMRTIGNNGIVKYFLSCVLFLSELMRVLVKYSHRSGRKKNPKFNNSQELGMIGTPVEFFLAAPPVQPSGVHLGNVNVT